VLDVTVDHTIFYTLDRTALSRDQWPSRRAWPRTAAASLLAAACCGGVLAVAHRSEPNYSADHAAGVVFTTTHGLGDLTVGRRVYLCTGATRAVYGDPTFLAPDHRVPGAERAFWEGCSGASIED